MATEKPGKPASELIDKRYSDLHNRISDRIAWDVHPAHQGRAAFYAASTFSALPRGWDKISPDEPLQESLIKLLKANKIRTVAEIGPGQIDVLSRFADVFNKAGVKMIAVGHRGNEEYKRKGIQSVPEFAGNLGPEHKDWDLVCAHRVFSLGGRGMGGDKAERGAIHNATRGTLDLVRRLSKNGRLVLTEDWDALLIDGRKITPQARVLKWQKFPTDGRFALHSIAETELERGNLTKREHSIIHKAPNWVVLARKRKPLAERAKAAKPKR